MAYATILSQVKSEWNTHFGIAAGLNNYQGDIWYHGKEIYL